MTDGPTPEAAIERVATLTSAARATWFTFLGVLLFVGVTLLSIGDADFFAAESSVDLPLIGVAVPVSLFFLCGAGLAAVIHIYLHVFLEDLWSALAAAPSRVAGRPLASAIAPWLVSSFALRIRGWSRPEEAAAVTPTALGTIGSFASFTLLYGAAPALLAGLWLRSQPAHIGWLTVAIGLMLVTAAGVSLLSLRALRAILAPPNASPRPSWPLALGALIAVLIVVPLSLSRTVWDPLGPSITRHQRESDLATDLANWFRPAAAGLAGARLTHQASDWLPHEESVAAFAASWCGTSNDDNCRETGLADPAFRDAYRRHRHRWLALQHKPNLSKRHMDHANLLRAFLPGVVLDGAHLRRADMHAAQLEGISALRGDMTAAVLLNAHLDFARARYARFVGANMAEVSGIGADLVGADLSGANLAEADLRFGVLNTARFSGANLSEARLDEAALHRASLEGANLTDASLTGASLVQTDLSDARLEATRLHGANLSSADFTDSFLSWTLIEHPGGFWFGRTDFSGAKLFGVAFRGIEAQHATFDGPEQLNWVFGDASTRLPEGMAPPCHWSDTVLDDRAFHSHWRGMVEAMSLQRQWASFVPEHYADVVPIPPPSGCSMTEFDYRAIQSPPRRIQTD